MGRYIEVCVVFQVKDMLEYWGGGSGVSTWHLTPSEVRKTLALRVDFQREEINGLKL